MEQKPTHFESLYPEGIREGEIQKIAVFVKEGNSCQLVSLPGVGRSTILGLLAFNSRVRESHIKGESDHVHFVKVNFSEIRKRPLSDATKLIFLQLTESLRERRKLDEYKKVHAYLQESLKLQDELVLFQGLKNAINYLAHEKKLTIIFLFDRFEEYVPMLSQEFFANLRVLREQAKFRFSVIFSLNRPLDELIEPALFADFYEYLAGHTIFLKLYDEVGMLFRLNYLEQQAQSKLPKSVYTDLVALTGGHAKLMKLSFEVLLGQAYETESLESFLLRQRTIRGALYEIWSACAPAEQESLLSNKFTQLSQQEYLVLCGLVAGGKLQIPLLASFMKNEGEVLQKEKKQLRYDEGTNIISRGETVLSDQLTASEFRLLRHFLLNPDTIIDRDQVIEIVWKDAKSTAGVTDQAVDQLIFRLRKKIEEHPTEPHHLQTVKGRGFKFTL